MADRSKTYKLAWRVIRYRYYHGEGERRPPEAYISRLAEFIGILLDGNAADALPRGAGDSYWDTWHESDLPPSLATRSPSRR